MVKVIDTPVEIEKAKKRYAFGIVFISLFIAFTIAGAVLLLILSPKHYTLMMILDIVFTTICLSVILFFFINLFPVLRHYYKFYVAMERCTMKRRKVVSFEREDERKVKDGVIYRQLIFSFKEAGETYHDRVMVLDNDSLSFTEGQVVKIATFQNVLLEYEEMKNATLE